MRRVLLTFALCLLTSAAHAAPHYTVTDLGRLPLPPPAPIVTYPGNISTTAAAINDKAQVVGQSNGQAFLWEKGVMRGLGTLPAFPNFSDLNISQANAISDTGEIVGGSGGFGPIVMSGLYFCRPFRIQHGKMESLPPPDERASYEAFGVNSQGDIAGLQEYRAFVLHGSTRVDLSTLSHVPVGNRGQANGINQRGQIVGSSTISVRRNVPNMTIPVHAALWQQTQGRWRATDLGTLPGFVNSDALAINAQGQIVGDASTYDVDDTDRERHRAFLWNKGRMTALPGAGDSTARALNDRNQIVGALGHKATLWQTGQAYDLNALTPPTDGRILTNATGINNHGQIAANGTLHGQTEAFLLTPQ